MRSHILSLAGVLMLSVAAPVAVGAPASPDPDALLKARVEKILKSTPLIDGHNDLPWKIREEGGAKLAGLDLLETTGRKPRWQTDLNRLRAGRVGGQFWSVYVPMSLKGAEATRAVLEQIDLVKRMSGEHSDRLEMAYTAADVVRIHKAGKTASMIGMEGGHSINNSLSTLRALYAAGARYMTLAHFANTDWADSATDDPAFGGLSPFGETVVREMNRLGMLVDLSHVSPDTMRDALAVALTGWFQR